MRGRPRRAPSALLRPTVTKSPPIENIRYAARRAGLAKRDGATPSSADAALRLGDASVSRHHSRLTLAQGDVTIADLGSRNGTIVNGERVAEGSRALGAGDVVSLGEVILVLHRLTGTDAASRITDLRQ